MGNILFWIISGILAGWLTKMIIPSENPLGIIGDFAVGIIGAVTSGLLAKSLLEYPYGLLINISIAFLGSVVLLFVIRTFNSKRVSRRYRFRNN